MQTSVEGLLVSKIRTAYESLPEQVTSTALRSIVDLMGVAISASSYKSIDSFIDAMEYQPPQTNNGARTVGRGRLMTMQAAAAVNAMAGHIHDYDDDDPVACLGHPTVVVFSAALAAADYHDVDTRKLLAAHTVGVETVMRLGLIANPHHYNAGWHATASLGIFGATVAVGLLLELDDAQLETALCIAVSLASGLKCNFGSDMKPMQVGLAAANAVAAAQLARAGNTASHNSLFGPSGYLRTYSSQRDPREIIENFGNPYCLLSPGLNIKIYPCCSSCHTSVDGLLDIMGSHQLADGDIERVDAWIGKDVPAMLIYDRPNNGLEGKFSLRYTLAAALLSGSLTLPDYKDEAVSRPAVQDAMSRVNIHVDPDIPENSQTGVTHQARVRVTTRDGRIYEKTVLDPRGSPANPISDNELKAKFMTCAADLLDETAAESAYAHLLTIARGGSSRELISALIR
jgi:2-methylcitrate dehydratase PrpD